MASSLHKSPSAQLVDELSRHLARAGAYNPLAWPSLHNVSITRDVPYRPTSLRDHTLDIYQPRTPGPHPVVLHIHGGGFHMLSKDTHWLMALAFARAGYVVFNINYRLAPKHPFPAALEDTCRAYAWICEHAHDFGGDPDQIIVAGESAGANLTTALVLATALPRPEPWAHLAYATGHVPIAAIPICGLLQVSDPERFLRRRHLPRWIQDRITEVTEAYLDPVADRPGLDRSLADPLVVLEHLDTAPTRRLPSFFIPVGTRDPVLDDSRRLARALDRLHAPNTLRFYPGEVHGFHAFVWRRQARQAWRDILGFCDTCCDRRKVTPLPAAPRVAAQQAA